MGFGGMIGRASMPMGGIGAAAKMMQTRPGGAGISGMASRMRRMQNPNAMQQPAMVGANGFQQLPQPAPVKVSEPAPGPVPPAGGMEMMQGAGQVDPWSELKKAAGPFNAPQLPQRRPQYGGYNPGGGGF